MNIGLFLGDGQYGAAGHFLGELAGAWRAAGHRVVEIVAGPQVGRDLQAAVDARVDFVFGYNGFGGHLNTLYTRLGARFVAWFVDHPVHHRERLLQLPAGALVACVDRTHLACLPRLCAVPPATLWLPHFGCRGRDPGRDRQIAVMLPGTVHDADAIRASWQSLPGVRDLAEALVDRGAWDDRVVWHEALEAIAASAGADPTLLWTTDSWTAVSLADRFVRARRRAAALGALARAGVRATVAGQVAQTVSELDGHDIRGPVTFAALLEMMAHALVVVDTGAAFPLGSHERGLSAMAAGAVAVVEANGFWEQFSDAEVLRFSWRDLGALGDGVRAVIAAPLPDIDRAQAGARAVALHHTAAHRAALVVERVRELR